MSFFSKLYELLSLAKRSKGCRMSAYCCRSWMLRVLEHDIQCGDDSEVMILCKGKISSYDPKYGEASIFLVDSPLISMVSGSTRSFGKLWYDHHVINMRSRLGIQAMQPSFAVRYVRHVFVRIWGLLSSASSKILSLTTRSATFCLATSEESNLSANRSFPQESQRFNNCVLCSVAAVAQTSARNNSALGWIGIGTGLLAGLLHILTIPNSEIWAWPVIKEALRKTLKIWQSYSTFFMWRLLPPGSWDNCCGQLPSFMLLSRLPSFHRLSSVHISTSIPSSMLGEYGPVQ